ncbi:hypothetical protein J1G44_00555 [Cellulomonas sp. zg-ZUI199]|uniref:Uncharacterized protein n=1 Tax=Cellulomonas wangleii TaxID=2816956 RepID=A0ABX8D6J2_9CELL|nr:hypothetical protein [Cellulomonas wangleii]MBO0922972.1 hypothetical protein [Cellulomonas wangleii]QVI61362.1 hypothetical protein KG103_12840 [Cellulomonas wangleii]
MAVFTRRNLRRTAHLWSWVALLGGPFVLVMGVLLVTGTGPGAQRPVEMWRTGAAGSAVELLPSGRDTAVWGRPSAEGVTCTTARSSGQEVATLPVGSTEGRPATVRDAGGTGEWTLLALTGGTAAAADVTCSGGDLTEVAVSADPGGPRSSSGFGGVLVLVGPVLLLLGWVTRRALRAGDGARA